MKELVGACIFAQSGGPTAVINCSAYGVIRTALDAKQITKVYGAAYGIKGVLNDELYVMDLEDREELDLLMQTPSSALGSCRYKLKKAEDDDTDYRRILEIFKKYDVRYFFYNGGNDSMDTCAKISDYMRESGYECRVMGVPKTIDNDVMGTDHTPGYASAAKYVATSCMELFEDASVYDTGSVCVVEIMGRHAGWLTMAAHAATASGKGPDLIYLPERDFDVEVFLKKVKEVFDTRGNCLVAVSEGIHDKDGKLIAEYSASAASDAFGHKQLGGLAATLAQMVKDRYPGTKVRPIELSLLQRCAAHFASPVDCEEAFLAGKTAVEKAIEGESDKMIAIIRDVDENGKYSPRFEPVGLWVAANTEKPVPQEWINEEGNGLNDKCLDYLLPLFGGQKQLVLENGMPRFAKLKKIKAE